MALGDFDLDGDLDLVVGAISAPFGTLWIYNRGTGQFSKSGVFPVQGFLNRAVGVGDFDRDGDLDIVISDGVNGLKIIRNDIK